MPGTLGIEQRRRGIGIAEHERRGLVDGCRACARGGIRLLSGVQAQRVEAMVVG